METVRSVKTHTRTLPGPRSILGIKQSQSNVGWPLLPRHRKAPSAASGVLTFKFWKHFCSIYSGRPEGDKQIKGRSEKVKKAGKSTEPSTLGS